MPPSASRFRPSARRSTCSSANEPGAESRSMMPISRTSSGLSSMSRTRIEPFCATAGRGASSIVACVSKTQLLRGQPDDAEPEVLDAFDNTNKMIQLQRLRDVTVCLQPVRARNVLFRFRCGENDHRNALELFILLDFREHFAPVFARKIQIEQNQVRPRRLP